MNRTRAFVLIALGVLCHGGQEVQAGPYRLNLFPKVVASQSPLLNQLQAARQLLVLANHNYAGHRDKAGYEISAAIHELINPGSTITQMAIAKKPGSGISPLANFQVKPGMDKKLESRVVADSQLLQASQLLKNTQSLVAPNQVAVQLHIQAALDEIELALRSR